MATHPALPRTRLDASFHVRRGPVRAWRPVAPRRISRPRPGGAMYSNTSAGERTAGPARKVTVPDIRARKAAGPALAMVTAYDFTMARLMDEAGVDIILVGDSLGMVVQGLK